MKRRKDITLALSDIKILDTINELNKINRYPTSVGVYKILSGSTEVEYQEYKYLNTYNTLTSQSCKHISRQIVSLIKNEYVARVYHPESAEEFLQILEKGVKNLLEFHKRHKKAFKKAPHKQRIEIIEIK